MLKAPRGLTLTVAALGGGWGGLFPRSGSQQPPEMGFWYSRGTGEKTGRGKDSMLGIRSCAQTTIQGNGKK